MEKYSMKCETEVPDRELMSAEADKGCICKKKQITAAGKRIDLFCRVNTAVPLVIYHAVQDEGNSLWETCNSLDCAEFSLAVVHDVSWNSEMSPWKIQPISKKDTPCSGEADNYLTKLTEKIIPAIHAALPETPTQLMLAGYSLAGLFAVYAAYRTDCFSAIASASGSLWYPDIVEFIRTHRISERTRTVYFSLGNKESHTRNPFLTPVEENTITIEKYLHLQGIDTVYERNPGNHYQDSALRMAKGIRWILER